MFYQFSKRLKAIETIPTMSKAPIYLISVNKTPKRAALLVGQFLENLSNNHSIIHIANASSESSSSRSKYNY